MTIIKTSKHATQAVMIYLAVVTFCFCAMLFIAFAVSVVIPFSSIGPAVNYFNFKQKEVK